MKYINTKRHGKLNSTDSHEMTLFMDSFLDTQMYQMFIQDRVWPSERNFEVLLFDAYIEKNNTTKRVDTSQSSFLDDTSQEITLTTNIKMNNDCLTTYLHQPLKKNDDGRGRKIEGGNEKFNTERGKSTGSSENNRLTRKRSTGSIRYQYNGIFPSSMNIDLMKHISNMKKIEKNKKKVDSGTHLQMKQRR